MTPRAGDPASEYGRLLAQRDRLIAGGADPDELLVPLPPVTLRAAAMNRLIVEAAERAEERRLDPDPLTIQPEWQAEAEAALAEHRTGYRRQGCSVLPWLAGLAFWAAVAILLLLLAGCSAQPAGNATPRTAPDLPAQSGAPQNVRADGSGEHKAGAAGASTRRGLASPATESAGAPPLTPEVLAADVTYSGIVNYAEPGLGRWYLAIPDGRGVRVEICGPAGCLIRTSTDAGPALALQRAGRIADLNSVDWAAIAGVPLRRGGFQGTILIVKRPPRIALPQTSTGGEP